MCSNNPAVSVTSNNRSFYSSEVDIALHSENVQYHLPANRAKAEFTTQYHVLLLGFRAAGKTALIARNVKHLYNHNYTPSFVEEKSFTKQIIKDQNGREIVICAQVTDLPGSFLEKDYYGKTLCNRIQTHDGIILALDSTKSFNSVKQGLEKFFKILDYCFEDLSDMKNEHVEHGGHQMCIVIALTKVDLLSKVQVTIEKVQDFLDRSNLNKIYRKGIRVVETSVLYEINVSVLFQNVVQMCYNSQIVGMCNMDAFCEQPILAESVLGRYAINDDQTNTQIQISSPHTVIDTQK